MKQPRYDPAADFRAARHDQTLFGALYRRHAPAMWRTAWQVLRQEDDAWDVVQRSFVKLLEKPEQLRELDSVEAWVVTVARHEALDAWRRRRPQMALDESRDHEGPHVDPQAQTLANEALTLLEQALSHLSGEEREILRLRVQEDMDYPAIARVLNKRPGAVRVALHRARRKLEALMEKADET